jgi:hypothetical protein
MFKNHNTCMAVGGGLIIISILAMSYSLWVSVPIFSVGAYFAFIKAPQTHIGNTPGSEEIVTKPPIVSRNARCPCGSGKRYKNCCKER